MLPIKPARFSLLKGWWWVTVSVFLIGVFYLHALKSRNASLKEMAFRFHQMEKEYFAALQEKDDLQLRIASQNDPAWVEMVLMREIGVVPEGWIKVHFKQK